MVDGKFVEELKDLKLKFRGSSNQRIIDVKKSLKKGEVVHWEFENAND
jgi:anaerobic ribonucleoside-triphosphate reductase activating protein